LKLFHDARQAGGAFSRAIAEATRDDDVAAAGGAPDYEVSTLPWAYVGGSLRSPELLVCLPAIEPGHPPFAWPAGYSLERPKVTGEAAAYG